MLGLGKFLIRQGEKNEKGFRNDPIFSNTSNFIRLDPIHAICNHAQLCSSSGHEHDTIPSLLRRLCLRNDTNRTANSILVLILHTSTRICLRLRLCVSPICLSKCLDEYLLQPLSPAIYRSAADVRSILTLVLGSSFDIAQF